MANNNKNNNSGLSTLVDMLILTVVIVVLALGLGWATNWYTDWTFSTLTETFSALFPSDDDDTISGTDEDGDSTDAGSPDDGSSGTASGDESGSSATEESGHYIYYEVKTGSTFDYVLMFDCQNYADESEVVNFTVTVTGDCYLYNIIIEGYDGTEIGYTTFSGGKYAFVMPAQDVTVVIYLDEVTDDTDTDTDTDDSSSSSGDDVGGGGYAGGGYGGGGGSGR